MDSKKIKKVSLRLLLPFFAWIVLFRHFVFGEIPLAGDTGANYACVKFFLNNLWYGVIPLWDPFVSMGRPYSFLAISVVLNPLLSFFVFGLNWLGVDYYHAYLTGIVTCYFIGLLGFYALVKAWFKDDLSAFLAYIFLMFSGAGVNIFNQIVLLFIFVPGVWFLYFLVKFARTFKKAYFVGLTFSLMLVMTCYLPFHFVTVLMFFMICFVVLSPRATKEFLVGLGKFSKKNVRTVAICLIAVTISCLPLLLAKTFDNKSENLFPLRHCQYTDKEGCFNKTFYADADMSYLEACSGSLGWRVFFNSLFSHMDKRSYAQDGMFYVPVFAFLLILTAFFTPYSKRVILLCAVGLLIFLVSVADASFLHRFLYKIVFYFKYFRNFFFFIAFLIPVFILIAITQLKALFEHEIRDAKQQRQVQLFVAFAHLAFFVFLLRQGNVMITSYLVVFGSWIFFSLYFLGVFRGRKPWLLMFLVTLILLEPIQFIYYYGKNAQGFKCPVPSNRAVFKFQFKRPEEFLKSPCKYFQYMPTYIDTWYTMLMTDSPVTMNFTGNMSRWVFFLGMKIGPDLFKDYATNKLVVYDAVEFLNEQDWEKGLAKVKRAFEKKENVAFINERVGILAGQDRVVFLEGKENPLVIDEKSAAIRILRFDSNSLNFSAGFDSPKFLVYNDSFNSHWRAFVNGHEVKIYRANVAFKGIYLPAGINEVLFVYSPFGGQWIYWFILVFHLLFFIYTLRLLFAFRSLEDNGTGRDY